MSNNSKNRTNRRRITRETLVGRNGCYEDHLGNYFSTIRSMCDCWGIDSTSTFMFRMNSGWGLKKSLTFGSTKESPNKDTGVLWIFGEPFPNHRAVDLVYGFAPGTTIIHKDEIESWLMSQQVFFVDGKLYRTYSAIAYDYNISESCLHSRLKRGYSLEDAVHTPIRTSKTCTKCSDHLGNAYESVVEMLVYYGISQSVYYRRLSRGWSLERTLTTPTRDCMRRNTKIIERSDMSENSVNDKA